jgi:hypothetical protein
MDNQTDQHKQHCVLSFSRWDLVQIGIPQEKVASLTEEDIDHIVKELQVVYRKGGYMEALCFYTKFFFVFKMTETAQTDNH